MKPIVILFFFGLCISVLSCNNSPAEDDSESVKQVIEAYFDGIKTRDGKKMKAVTTDDFLLYEDGRVFNNDSLISFLNSFSSLSGEFTLDSMKINVDDNIANMVYLNRGDLVFNDTIRATYIWLESATFKKVDGVWKMDFLHSTVRK
ncbi:MAG: nuclear transport factor 2 family protein [Cyclobacteriaceae bacterium]